MTTATTATATRRCCPDSYPFRLQGTAGTSGARQAPPLVRAKRLRLPRSGARRPCQQENVVAHPALPLARQGARRPTSFPKTRHCWRARGSGARITPRGTTPPLQEAFQFSSTKKGNRHWQVPGRVYWGKRRSVGGAASLSAPSPLPSPLPLRPHPLPAFFPLTLPRPLLQGVELGPAAPPPTVAERRAATSVFG